MIRENDNFIEKSELINYRKLVILGSRLRSLLRFKRVKYHWIPVLPNVFASFRNLPAATLALKNRPSNASAVMQPLLAQQLQLNLSDSPKTQSKFQTLKRSVLSFSPRTDGSQSNRDKGSGTQRTFSTKSSKRPPLSTEHQTVVLPPENASSGARATSPVLGSPSPNFVPLASPTGTEVKALSTSGESQPATSSRWSRAFPRSSSGGLTSGLSLGQKVETTSPRQAEEQEVKVILEEAKIDEEVKVVHVSGKADDSETNSDSAAFTAIADKSDLSYSSDEQEDEGETKE